jgi:hypothetical protein
MLAVSAGLALRCLLLDIGERMGPPVAHLLVSPEVYDSAFEMSILWRLAGDLWANRRALARKAPHLTNALIFMTLAVGSALVGSV